MKITIDLNAEEQRVVELYAEQHNMTVEQALKSFLLEEIADVKAAEAVYAEWIKDGRRENPFQAM